MPKHTWKTTIVTDNGQGPTDSIDLYGSAEQNIGGTSVGQKGLPVGVQDVEQVNIGITVANIVSFFIKSTTDMRLRVNSEVSPAQEVDLVAGKAFGWNNADIPQPSSNPLTTNITALYFYNKGTVNGVTPSTGLAAGTVLGGFLLEQESLFS
jgi:hypothetical protein